jgi:N-acetylneuraminate synthase
MTSFDIKGRAIGAQHPTFIIAEIGINHGGSLETAKAMVDAAHAAGVEVIKHQTHVIEDEMSPEAKSVIPGNADRSIYSIMEECALDEHDETELMHYVESSGMIFISTPFSRAAADRLERMGVAAYKIGSGECNNYPLIRHVAAFGKPMIISTGMNTLASVGKTVKILEDARVPYALLHCTNLYPTPPEFVRLGALDEMRQAFPKAVLGLSDHSLTNTPCLGAVALGADILERHFTDSMTREGPDIVCSMDPSAFQELKHNAEIMRLARGGSKGPLAEEQVTIDFAFASVVTTKAIKKGEPFNRGNLWVRRPGTGEIAAEYFDDVLGKCAAVDIDEPRLLKKSDIA